MPSPSQEPVVLCEIAERNFARGIAVGGNPQSFERLWPWMSVLERLASASGMRVLIVRTDIAPVLMEIRRRGLACNPESFEAVFRQMFQERQAVTQTAKRAPP